MSLAQKRTNLLLRHMSQIVGASWHWLCKARFMDEAKRHSASHEAAKALYRSLVRAALSWNVDPATATHNPVFMWDGALNYVSHHSSGEATHWFLRETGILKEGHNGAHRLTVPLHKIDVAADAAFDAGIDTDRIVEILVGFLFDESYSFRWKDGPDLAIQISPPRATSINFPDEAEEIEAIMRNLQILGYIRAIETKGEPEFRWTTEALPILKRLYLISGE